MIPENLLFQNTPVFFLSDRSFLWIFLCIVLSLMGTWIYRYFTSLKKINPIQGEKEVYTFPERTDINFEIKITEILRKKLSKKYYPHHSFAHTSLEMSEYVHEKNIVDIVRMLESAEYSDTKIPLEERMSLMNEVISL